MFYIVTQYMYMRISPTTNKTFEGTISMVLTGRKVLVVFLRLNLKDSQWWTSGVAALPLP